MANNSFAAKDYSLTLFLNFNLLEAFDMTQYNRDGTRRTTYEFYFISFSSLLSERSLIKVVSHKLKTLTVKDNFSTIFFFSVYITTS